MFFNWAVILNSWNSTCIVIAYWPNENHHLIQQPYLYRCLIGTNICFTVFGNNTACLPSTHLQLTSATLQIKYCYLLNAISKLSIDGILTRVYLLVNKILLLLHAVIIAYMVVLDTRLEQGLFGWTTFLVMDRKMI